LFVPEINLIVEINGPSHYYEGTREEMPRLIGRLISAEHKVLSLSSRDTTEKVLAFGKLDMEDIDDEKLVVLKQQIKTYIN